MSLITQFRDKDFIKGFNHYNGVFEKTGLYFDILLMEENDRIEICEPENEIAVLIINGAGNIEYNNSVATTIRTIKGTNFNYFSNEAKNKFFNEEYQVTNLSDRMGMRLEGPKLENIVNTNIKSEGLVKGVVQVPSDGNPIIMFSDHGSIGGYPKIAVVITADHDKAAQLIPGSKIKFKEVNLDEAEKLFKSYSNETKNYIEQIK